MLAAVDAVVVAGLFGFLGVLVTVIGGVVIQRQKDAAAAALMAAGVAEGAASSIGVANGHGNLHAAVATVIDRLDGMAERQDLIVGRIDAQDVRAEQEWQRRENGQARMLAIQDAVFSTQEDMAAVKRWMAEQNAWQITHTDEDALAFTSLRESVEHLTALLGEPAEGDVAAVPLIAYVHNLAHDLTNTAARVNDAQGLMVGEAIAMLEEARDLLDEVKASRPPKEKP